jgi:hypothetical protein
MEHYLRLRRVAALTGTTASAALLTAAAVGSLINVRESTGMSPSEEVVRSSVRATADTSSVEIFLVFIGAPTCPASTPDAIATTLAQVQDRVHAQTTAQNVRFARLGVAVSNGAADGVRYLEEVGEFDEVIAGGGWRNTGIHRFVDIDLPGIAMTPQVIIVRRVRRTGVLTESVLVRKAGNAAIQLWNSRGAPLPDTQWDLGVGTT